MYLLYIDESGEPKGKKPTSSKYFVLSGIAMHEEDCFPFARSLDAIISKAHPNEPGIEIHASPIWAGRSEWARVPLLTRHALLKELFVHLGTWTAPSGRPPRYFAAAVHKDSHRGRDLLKLAHEELFARFDSCMSRFHRAGDSHRSLVISDESSYEKLMQSIVPQWKKHGSRIGKLHSLVEVPLYVNSKSSRLVQAADLVAWATWQYYENQSSRFIQPINERFDCDGGIQHGLVHLNSAHKKCACGPCASHRNRVIAAEVPTQF